MKIISINLNGIRSAFKKNFMEWMLRQDADVVCMQEVRIQEEHLTETMANPPGYRGVFHLAEKKGYSGVGLYVRQEPHRVQEGIGWHLFDQEGRFLQADWGNVSIVSLYLPSGSSSEERQDFKYQTMGYLTRWMQECRDCGREFVLCGDWNIAHKEIDIKNWKGNLKNSGFLPAERAWMTEIFDDIGFVDVFRQINPEPEQYTWWSNRGRAWEKNVGWRLDYQIATPEIASFARHESIYREERFSDHAPLTITYDYSLPVG